MRAMSLFWPNPPRDQIWALKPLYFGVTVDPVKRLFLSFLRFKWHKLATSTSKLTNSIQFNSFGTFFAWRSFTTGVVSKEYSLRR